MEIAIENWKFPKNDNDAVFLGCTKLSPGFAAVGSKNVLGILGLFESLGM